MSAVIWKYPLLIEDVQMVEMPIGARPLTVQTQYGRPMLWALVDPEAPLVSHAFATYGTGHQRTRIEGGFVGSYQLDGGALVFHVFAI